MMNVFASAGLVAVFCFLWAAIETFGSGAHLPAYQVEWLRFATHLAVLIMCCGWSYRGSLSRTDLPWIQLLRSSMMMGMPPFAAGAGRMEVPTLLGGFWIAPALLFASDREAAKSPLPVGGNLGGTYGGDPHAAPRAGFTLSTLVYPGGMAACLSGCLILTRVLK